MKMDLTLFDPVHLTVCYRHPFYVMYYSIQWFDPANLAVFIRFNLLYVLYVMCILLRSLVCYRWNITSLLCYVSALILF